MRWDKYIKNAQTDLKLFALLLVIICLYRTYFMLYMNGYMSDGADFSDIAIASWAGFRLSLKSAGIMAAVPFVFCTLVNIPFPKIDFTKVRLFFGSACIFALSVLFQARFPYYRQYGTSFNTQVMEGLADDRYAIFLMMVQEYGLIWRFLIALALTVIGCMLWKRLLGTGSFKLSLPLSWNYAKKIMLGYIPALIITFLFCLFIRFGASFNYEHSINWENAALTKDAFLNECILDDIQALYRARQVEEMMQEGNVEGIQPETIRLLAKKAAGQNIESDKLSDYITRKAAGAKLPKPRHIFIIMGESWAQWPMLDQYAQLHAADGLRSLIAEENSCYVQSFLPNGNFTSISINGIITNLGNVGLRANYMPESYKEAYPTAMPEAFHRLGYRVDFWYGGTTSWDGFDKMAKAQGFDSYYGYPDFGAPKQSVWGTKDAYLFDAIYTHLTDEEPTVHVVMTTTNHPPYNLDLAAEGFDLDKEKAEAAKLPDVENSDELAVELGHYWYMDKIVTDFVRKTAVQYPDSLFVITGDHAVRMNPSVNPTMFEFQTVPFVLYGQGVSHELIPAGTAGCHNSIMPTLVELIAPAGFEYCSLAESMTYGGNIAFNQDCWITANMIGSMSGNQAEALPGAAGYEAEAEKAKLSDSIEIYRTLTWWFLKKGNSLEE